MGYRSLAIGSQSEVAARPYASSQHSFMLIQICCIGKRELMVRIRFLVYRTFVCIFIVFVKNFRDPLTKLQAMSFRSRDQLTRSPDVPRS
jgi:hypothetical protein